MSLFNFEGVFFHTLLIEFTERIQAVFTEPFYILNNEPLSYGFYSRKFLHIKGVFCIKKRRYKFCV